MCLIITSPLLLVVKLLDLIGRAGSRDRVLSTGLHHAAPGLSASSPWRKSRSRESKTLPTARRPCFAVNHMSLMDAFLIHGYLGRLIAHVSVKQVKMVPVLGGWVNNFGSVFLDRDDFWQSLRCAEQAVGRLKQGRSMVVFPEGRIIYRETLGQFKAGSLQMAVRGGRPGGPGDHQRGPGAFL